MADNPTARSAACSLAPDALGDRVGAWRALARTALHRDAQPGRIVSTYPQDPEIAEQLARLVEAEQQCCPFLEFDVREDAATISVELRYPPAFAAMLDSVLG